MITENYDCTVKAQVNCRTIEMTIDQVRSEYGTDISTPVIDLFTTSVMKYDNVFNKSIKSMADQVGIASKLSILDPGDIIEVHDRLLEVLDRGTNGIVLSRPSYNPDNHDEFEEVVRLFTQLVPHYLDVDRMFSYIPSEEIRYPPVVESVREVLESYSDDLSTKNAVVIGCSEFVGVPMTSVLSRIVDTVTLLHNHTLPGTISSFTDDADIIITSRVLDDIRVPEDSLLIDIGNDSTYRKLNGQVRSCTTHIGKLTVSNILLNVINNYYDSLTN